MRVAVILTFEVATPEDVPDIITHMDPPTIPGFDGEVRITTEPYLSEMLDWLDR